MKYRVIYSHVTIFIISRNQPIEIIFGNIQFHEETTGFRLVAARHHQVLGCTTKIRYKLNIDRNDVIGGTG